MFCRSWCRCSDQGGPAFIIDIFLSKFIDMDDLGVSQQKGRQGSHVGESGQRQNKRGVDLVIWEGA